MHTYPCTSAAAARPTAHACKCCKAYLQDGACDFAVTGRGLLALFQHHEAALAHPQLLVKLRWHETQRPAARRQLHLNSRQQRNAHIGPCPQHRCFGCLRCSPSSALLHEHTSIWLPPRASSTRAIVQPSPSCTSSKSSATCFLRLAMPAIVDWAGVGAVVGPGEVTPNSQQKGIANSLG